MAEVWRDVLESDDISEDDDFFALGGDSMRAVQLVTQLEQRLDTELDLMLVFDAPTIRAMTSHLVDTLNAEA